MILIVLFSLLLFGCGKFEELAREEDLLERPQAKRCADCHAEIFKEWEKSRHAKAWVSEKAVLKIQTH